MSASEVARLSIIVASSGRSTLQRTINSIVPQLRPGDELLVDVNADSPWGHRARQRQMERARGDFLLFIDDDDIYLDGALDLIRAQDPDQIHIFRMYRCADGSVLWIDPVLRLANVSTQLFVVPNKSGWLGSWESDHRWADYDFIAETAAFQGEPEFHEQIICHYGVPS